MHLLYSYGASKNIRWHGDGECMITGRTYGSYIVVFRVAMCGIVPLTSAAWINIALGVSSDLVENYIQFLPDFFPNLYIQEPKSSCLLRGTSTRFQYCTCKWSFDPPTSQHLAVWSGPAEIWYTLACPRSNPRRPFLKKNKSHQKLPFATDPFHYLNLEEDPLGFPHRISRFQLHLNQGKMEKWVLPKIGGKPPKWIVKIMDPTLLKWMSWGTHPYFWKHPYVEETCHNNVNPCEEILWFVFFSSHSNSKIQAPPFFLFHPKINASNKSVDQLGRTSRIPTCRGVVITSTPSKPVAGPLPQV